jgi:hypothetical protein
LSSILKYYRCTKAITVHLLCMPFTNSRYNRVVGGVEITVGAEEKPLAGRVMEWGNDERLCSFLTRMEPQNLSFEFCMNA